MEPDNPLLDDYILAQADADAGDLPVVCFVGTASGDSADYIVKFYSAFNQRPCRPRHLSLFRQAGDLSKFVLECDVIYVGGGNTRNAIAIWKAAGLDVLLREAWENGTILCGISAGAICWFEQGLTDSEGALTAMDCLGFVPGSCTPHYDGEPERKPAYRKSVADGTLAPGYAIDNSAALHFVDDEEPVVVSSVWSANAYAVTKTDAGAAEELLKTRFLGAQRAEN